MDKKSRKIITALSLFALVVGLGLFIWGLGAELASLMNGGNGGNGGANNGQLATEGRSSPQNNADDVLQSQLFSEVLVLEGQVYDFINDELDAIAIARGEFEEEIPIADEDEELNAIGESEQATEEQLQFIADLALEKIDAFSNERGDALPPSLHSRLDKLRLSIAMRLLTDIDKVEQIINSLPPDEEKLGAVTFYIANFAKSEEQRVKKFVAEQAVWAKQLNNKYEQEMATSLFNSAPLGKTFPNHFKDAYTVDGKPLNLENFRGKYVLIDFWASWCLPCVEELPYIKEMHSRFSPEQLVVVGVSLDADRQAFERFLENYAITWRQHFDNEAFEGELAQRYGILSLPSKFLLDENGKVLMANNHADEMLNFMEQKLVSF